VGSRIEEKDELRWRKKILLEKNIEKAWHSLENRDNNGHFEAYYWEEFHWLHNLIIIQRFLVNPKMERKHLFLNATIFKISFSIIYKLI
jgi:hypothetical protein